jgi:UDP-N-acetylmuramyl pentapeptide phosphotransferase/UDP-N-acetylglucosamine-1-phosphate transferase
VALMGGATVYAGIVIVQLIENGEVRLQALGALFLLCVSALITWADDEHRLKRYEMVLLWICVLTFSVYTILRTGGLV